jgi:hypothetical protein
MATSMRGKVVDMDKLARQNELAPAIGNAKFNARGDRLGPNGQIVERREDMVAKYYEVTTKAETTAQQQPSGSIKTVTEAPVINKSKKQEE